MKIRHALFGLALAACGSLSLTGASFAGDGEDMTLHNNTGHAVYVYLFQDADVHLNEKGGVKIQEGLIADHGSAVAHVPHCTFSIVLIDKDDVWHAEFHDCHSTDMTFTKDTGHAHRAP